MSYEIRVAGNNVHKANFIKQLNKEGFFPSFEEVEVIMEEDDLIVPENGRRFFLSSRVNSYGDDWTPTHILPEDWDDAMNEFRNVT